MFDKNYDQRLLSWSNFRKSLETSEDPIQDTINFYNNAPTISIHTDPWTPEMWPTPWELLQENQYCPFTSVLGMCYSLQLTERFSEVPFEIHIIVDRENSATFYLLYVGDIVIERHYEAKIYAGELTKDCEIKKVYCMEKLQ